MGLSRLEAFLKSIRGNIIHVDPNALDSTDSIENDGSSQMAPFKTINRALAEAARFSYQAGINNDRFGKTTIMLYSGEHYVDNRPGAIIDDNGVIKLRNGAFSTIPQWSLSSIFDIQSSNNELYKLNSIHGGLIVPRGVSIVANDIRKTIIRPLYVPDPVNDNIERSALFRLTGGSFLYGFSVLDADQNKNGYKDYTQLKEVLSFSHHKLTCFEYADGVNNVIIHDGINTISSEKTDLDMYYEKLSLVYGISSGRDIPNASYDPEYSLDIQPIIDEFRIVGVRERSVKISSIIAGDGGFNSTNLITVTTSEPVPDISTDTPIQISNISSEYDGKYVVFNVVNSNTFQYKAKNVPLNASPTIFDGTLNVIVDTVSSASPYIFNVSLRSVYGMCGLHADGSKCDGFKSMVVAQFTGISLQKDDNAFVLYDENTGNYIDSTSTTNLYNNSRSKYKPEYENYHIKASEGAFCQLVSVFAIGFANQFIVESGGDYSITNSNSNFGSKSLVSKGFSNEAYPRDDVGYISKIIPPKEILNLEVSVKFEPIDVNLTYANSVGLTTDKLYLYGQTDENIPPAITEGGYNIGSKADEILYLENSSARVVMPGSDSSYEKSYDVRKIEGTVINDISSGVIYLTSTHSLFLGEKVKILSDNGHLPDRIISDRIYYAIPNTSNSIRVADTLEKAFSNIPVLLNSNGGNLRVVSRVSDKNIGDPGHPIQWSTQNNNWYITVSPTNNTIVSYISNLVGQSLSTIKSYIKRKLNNRVPEESIYKFRYVIPKDSRVTSRPPLDNYIIQHSNNTSISQEDLDNSTYFENGNLTFSDSLRNPKIISNVVWQNGEVTVDCELNHDLTVGSLVKINKVIPSEYNGSFVVTEVLSSKRFKYDLEYNPGTFSNNTSIRNVDLPTLQKQKTKNTYKIYGINEIEDYDPGRSDGVYDIILLSESVSPIVSPFKGKNFSQPIKNLYPRIDKDNLVSDPEASECFALSNTIGEVVINDPVKSVTKECLTNFLVDFNIGIGITSIISTNENNHKIFTDIEHGLSQITSISINNPGSNYIPGTYFGCVLSGSSTGSDGTVVCNIDGNGQLVNVTIMDGGAGYSEGDILTVIPNAGVGVDVGFIPGEIRVDSVSNNIGNVVSITDTNYQQYNKLYHISSVPSSREIELVSANTISNFSSSLLNTNSSALITAPPLLITDILYNNETGYAIFSTNIPHGFRVFDKVQISGFSNSLYNGEFIIERIIQTPAEFPENSFEVYIGPNQTVPPTTGQGRVYVPGNNTSEGGKDRGRFLYNKIYSLSGSILPQNSSSFLIDNAKSVGFKLGDFIEVNGEIMRISSQVTSNTVSVYRAQLGTRSRTHPLGSLVKKVLSIPIELRRHSIIRASGHTFEYVGFGPGNYSTAFPDKQDRKLSESEKLLSQSFRESGGVVYYSGTDDAGGFFIGNKKIDPSSGTEKVFDTPIITFTGAENDPVSPTSTVLSATDAVIQNNIIVNNENNLPSQFSGPVLFNDKITSYSPEGAEFSKILLQGNLNVSRSYTVSSSIPNNAATYGDITFNSSPSSGGNIGWVYTTNNEWEVWGFVGQLDGTVSITDNTATNANRYITFIDQTSGNIQDFQVSSTKLAFNPSTGTLTTIELNTTSDKSKKTNISRVENALQILNNINGVRFNWIENGIPSVGIIAQDVEKVLPEIVSTDEVKSVNYNGLVAVLIEAVKDQQKEIEELRLKIDELINSKK